jgi:hypothetical protein
MSIQLRANQRVLATVRPRVDPLDGNAHRRRGVEGQQLELIVAYQQDDHGSYPGEFVLVPTGASIEALSQAGILWLASGDVIVDRVLSG